jgi:DNA-binding MarR family transcriptional regulator
VTDVNTALMMFIGHRWAEAQVMAGLREAGFVDITLAQARVAARLGPDGMRLTELAEQAQVTKQSAGFLVDQLERAGYVVRVPDPRDARARLVCIADRGHAAIEAARKIERRIEREWTRHLGAERMRQLRDILTDLCELTDPYA